MSDYQLHQDEERGGVGVNANRNSNKTNHRPSRNQSQSFHPRWSDYYDKDEDHIYLSPSVQNLMENDKKLTEQDKIVIQRLAMRSFHLPGNSYWQDLMQFWCNNHPIFAFTLADRRHPFGRRERIINLVASLAFGLAATSMVFLHYYYQEEDMDKEFISLRDGQFVLSEGFVMLTLFGGFCNVLFDFAIWFIQACPPCQPGGLATQYPRILTPAHRKFWLWIGKHIAMEITIIAIGLAIYVAVLKASVLDDGEDGDVTHTRIEDYAFLASYLLEVMTSMFVLFPLVSFIIFTGILGCFVIPGLGGRPYQVKAFQRRLEQKRLKEQKGTELWNLDDDERMTPPPRHTKTVASF